MLTELKGFLRYLATGETGHGRLPLLPHPFSASLVNLIDRRSQVEQESRRGDSNPGPLHYE